MLIVSGGQSGVDRAAMDVAIRRGIAYGGWCPRGGWAEDFPDPPGVLARYPLLRETPLADPAQRTEWNIRDSDAVLIILDAAGADVSAGTALAQRLAEKYGRAFHMVDADAPDVEDVADWLRAQLRQDGSDLRLGIGGPRESEAPGIYRKAAVLIETLMNAIGSKT